jgi:hypothetical protein
MSQLDWWRLDDQLYGRSNPINAQSFYKNMQQRTMVLMDNNRLAVVPGTARDGDVACLFEGGQSPYILRPRQDSHWRVISGGCRLFGSEEYLSEEVAPVFPYAAYCKKLKELMETFTIL